MQFDLKKGREKINKRASEIAKAAGIGESFYRKYEKENMIPCKYIYKIWKKYPEYPIPEDFFYYTSYSLQCNLTYHNLTQKDAAKILGLSGQPIISKYLSKNIPMYEYKEAFLKSFVPFIVPYIKEKDGTLKCINELILPCDIKKHKLAKVRDGDMEIEEISKTDDAIVNTEGDKHEK